MKEENKPLGKPIIMETSGEIEKFTRAKVVPAYNNVALNEALEKLFGKMDNPNKLRGKVILNHSRDYLKSLTKFVKIWETENHMIQIGGATWKQK